MSQYTQTSRDLVREQAEAERYAPLGEESKLKEGWKQVEAELRSFFRD